MCDCLPTASSFINVCDQPFCRHVDGALSTPFHIQPEVVAAGSHYFRHKLHVFVGRLCLTRACFCENEGKRGELKAG